jgi:hypothetical protein
MVEQNVMNPLRWGEETVMNAIKRLYAIQDGFVTLCLMIDPTIKDLPIKEQREAILKLYSDLTGKSL